MTVNTSTLPDYPFESQYADVGRWRMHYVDEGPRDAPIVVLVHGNPTWSYYYRRLIPALRPSLRVIAPDHIGMGLSARPSAGEYPFTLEQRVADLGKLLEQLTGGRDVALVVHDWGGMIGSAWAVEHAARVRRMVVLNTAAFRLPETERVPWQLRVVRTPVLGSVLVRGLNAFCRGAAHDCVCRPLPADVRRGYLAPYDSWHNRLAVLRFVEDIPLDASHVSYAVVRRTEEGLDRLSDVPMFVGWGMRDFVFRVSFLEEWERRFPDAAVHRFAEAGHYVLEDAGDELIPQIVEFLGQDVANQRPANLDTATGDTISSANAAAPDLARDSST